MRAAVGCLESRKNITLKQPPHLSLRDIFSRVAGEGLVITY